MCKKVRVIRPKDLEKIDELLDSNEVLLLPTVLLGFLEGKPRAKELLKRSIPLNIPVRFDPNLSPERNIVRAVEEFEKSFKLFDGVRMANPGMEAILFPEVQFKALEVLLSGRYVLGDKVREFERRFAGFLQRKYAVGVASGTDAIYLSLVAVAQKLGIKPSELTVFVPSFTFCATADAVVKAGAKPVFVDIDERFGISAQLLFDEVRKRKCENWAVIPVHLYGIPCDIDSVVSVARDEGGFVIEDCAQSFGSKHKGKFLGTFSHLSAFSFFPSKNLSCAGDGGAITTDDRELFSTISLLRVHGQKEKYRPSLVGTNSRLDEIQAGVLLAKLEVIDRIFEERRRSAEIYLQAFGGFERVKVYIPSPDDDVVFNSFPVLVDEGVRDELVRYLAENGVEAGIYYPVPLPFTPAFCGFPSTSCKRALWVSQRIVCLPTHCFLCAEKVADLVIRFFRRF